MAIAIARSIFANANGPGTPTTLTFGTTTTTGQILVVGVTHNSGGSVSTIGSLTDTYSNTWNTWTNSTQVGSNGKTRVALYETHSGLFGASHVVTGVMGNGGEGIHWGAIEFSGTAAIAVDTTSSNTAIGTCAGTDAACTTQGTLANGNVILIGVGATRGNFGTVNLNTPAGWTNLNLDNTAIGGVGSSICWKSATITGNTAQSIQFTHDGTDAATDWVAGIIVVRELAVSTAKPIHILYQAMNQ